MAVLSRKEIERLSRRLLRRYLGRTAGWVERIDPADLAEKLCGLRFVFADLSKSGSILGLTACCDVTLRLPGGEQALPVDRRTAYIDRSLTEEGKDGRLHFTMMHEAAHQLLAALFPGEYAARHQPVICRLAGERCACPVRDWTEWRTNVLAACLLMPRELIQKHMRDLGLGQGIRLLNRVFAPQEYALFSELALRLGVSKTALALRLQHLGLVDRNDFYDPYALVYVYADDFEDD